MDIKNSVLDYMIQLNWYGHVQRMDQERIPRRILEWCPPGRQIKGRPRNSWIAGGYNRNERAGNWGLRMGRQRGVEKED